MVSLIFIIEDSGEIALWVAAISNHSRVFRYFVRFVTLSKDSGFQDRSVEISYAEGVGSQEGLHFYRGIERVLSFPASHPAIRKLEKQSCSKCSTNPVLENMIYKRFSNQ